MVSSDNVWSAENQQERLTTFGWVVGFVDGEGCFSNPIYRCGKMTLRWQVRLELAVVQGASSRDVLEELVRFFGCGKVYRNRRHDNHREDLFRYCVQRYGDSSRSDRALLQGEPVARFEAKQLREVRNHHRTDGSPSTSLDSRNQRDSGDSTDDEPPQAIGGLENPQRPYAGPLQSQLKRKRWSGPYGDVGRLAETTSPTGEVNRW